MLISKPCEPIVGLPKAGADHPPLHRQGELLTQPPPLPCLVEQKQMVRKICFTQPGGRRDLSPTCFTCWNS